MDEGLLAGSLFLLGSNVIVVIGGERDTVKSGLGCAQVVLVSDAFVGLTVPV